MTLGGKRIWSVRRLLDLYYNSKISNTESKLEDLQSKQRDTVEKLKAATKFSTTQSIIEKYGGGSTTSADTEWEGQQQLQGGLQGHPNNQTPRQRPQGQSSRGTPPIPTTPQQIQQQLVQQQLMAQQRMTQQQQLRPSTSNPNPVQKPNASAPTPVLNLLQTTTQPSSQQHIQPEEATAPRWYDRLLDVLVGEDETSAKNRYTLICKNCRMVNGLAPPGIRNLEDIEGWGCARCGTVNGRLPSRPPSRRQEEEVEETHVVPDSEARNPKNRKSKSPTPNENVRTTRSKAKKEEVEDTDEGSGEESSEEGGSGEEEEKIPEPPKPKPKGRVTRGKRKV